MGSNHVKTIMMASASVREQANPLFLSSWQSNLSPYTYVVARPFVPYQSSSSRHKWSVVCLAFDLFYRIIFTPKKSLDGKAEATTIKQQKYDVLTIKAVFSGGYKRSHKMKL